jgi:hypothetical protein
MKPRNINNFLSNDDTPPFRAGSVIKPFPKPKFGKDRAVSSGIWFGAEVNEQ